MTALRLFPILLLAGLTLLACLTAGVSLGSASVPFTTVWSIVANKLSPVL